MSTCIDKFLNPNQKQGFADSRNNNEGGKGIGSETSVVRVKTSICKPKDFLRVGFTRIWYNFTQQMAVEMLARTSPLFQQIELFLWGRSEVASVVASHILKNSILLASLGNLRTIFSNFKNCGKHKIYHLNHFECTV